MMNMLKKIATLTLILTLAVSGALAEATPTDLVEEPMVEEVVTEDVAEEPAAEETVVEEVVTEVPAEEAIEEVVEEAAEEAIEEIVEETPAIDLSGCSVTIIAKNAAALGSEVVLEAVVEGCDDVAYTMQWYMNGVAIEGATAATHTVTVTEDVLNAAFTVSVTVL